MSTERISGTFGTITFSRSLTERLKGQTMTQDNGMSADATGLEEQLERAETEVEVLTNAVVDCGETIKAQQEQIDYLEYLITRKAEVG